MDFTRLINAVIRKMTAQHAVDTASAAMATAQAKLEEATHDRLVDAPFRADQVIKDSQRALEAAQEVRDSQFVLTSAAYVELQAAESEVQNANISGGQTGAVEKV